VIFVDTSFWVALLAIQDAHHDDARRLLRSHSGSHLVTSSLVRGETWTFLRRRYGHRAAVTFLDLLAKSNHVRVEPIDPSTDARALAWLRDRDEREYSHVDATSFALMRALQIPDAFAFDGDFAAAGFVELRP
jgi:predicted nucleic acid-binding protein